MAFTCTVPAESFDVQIFRTTEESNAMVHVGRDEDGAKNYFIDMGLSPVPPGDLEFYFLMIEADGNTNSERMIWDGREVGQIVSKEDRRVILGVLCSAAKLLIENVRPPIFVMTTRDACLPEPALAKYRRLHEVFIACGYSITRTDPYHGRQSWWMEREH